MNLRAAVVGAGRMGRERARAAKLLGAQLVAICDPDVERAALLAADLDAAVLPTAAELDLSRLDALFVCTPPALRGAAERAAIAAGVSLFVEKPIGLNAEQCLDLLQALEQRPIINAAGYMNRYRCSVLCARQQIQAAFPIAIAFQWFSTRYGVPGGSTSINRAALSTNNARTTLICADFSAARFPKRKPWCDHSSAHPLRKARLP